MTSYRDGWMLGHSKSSASPQDVVGGHYDVVVMTASWDSRCTCLTDADVTATVGIGIFFESRGSGALRDAHDPIVSQYLESRSAEFVRLTRASEDTDGLWHELWARVQRAAQACGRPIRVLLDLSTCPRIYAMALIGNGFRSQLVAEMTVFYAEGAYPARPVDEPHEVFTAGRWQTVPVPGLEGDSQPSKPRRYVVSVGFEGSKTMRAVSSEGADFVSVLFPRPGVREDYEERTWDDNQELLEEFGVSGDDVLDAAAGDAITAWRRLAEAAGRWSADDLFYLPCGPKPHAVGMALHSLTSGTASVMYAKPASHKEAETTALGKYWAYELRDVTSVPVARTT